MKYPNQHRQAKRALPTNSRQWRALRSIQLTTEPLCRHCKVGGRITPANEVDHINGDSNDNLASNLQSLCKSCHSYKTAVQDGAFGHTPNMARMKGCDVNGFPLGQNHPGYTQAPLGIAKS